MIFALLAAIAAFVLIIVLPIFATVKSIEAIQLAKELKAASNRLSARLHQVEQAKESPVEPQSAKAPVEEVVNAEVKPEPVSSVTPKSAAHPFQKEFAAAAPLDEILFIEPEDREPKTDPIFEGAPAAFTPKADSPKSNRVVEVTKALHAATSISSEVSSSNPYEEDSNAELDRTPSPEPTVGTTTQTDSFELRLGTYWFVRIGVLLLLSGLAFLAYAKRQYFFDLSPAARVTGFYLFSFALAGTGWWIQRVNALIRNYGQVLMAGGFAGVYFTTYAAHVIEPVLVFPDQTMVIGMLLFWGACLFFYSNWIKSETIAVFATGASYFATYLPLIHTPATDQWVILASNVILASTSVFFFLKNRWFKISVVSMLASYGGMTFCIARLGMVQESILILSVTLLWGLYTFATFVSRNEQFNDVARSVFSAVNNFIAASLVTYVAWVSGEFTVWQVAMLGGLLLLACSIALPYVQNECRICRNSYLSQGLLLANLGFIAMSMEGSFLGPILATQSLMLMVIASFKRDQFIEGVCFLMAIAASAFTLYDLASDNPFALAASVTVAALFFVAGMIYTRSEKVDDSIFRVKVTAYTLFSIGMLTSGLLIQAGGEPFAAWIPFIFLAIPVAFQACHRWHRVPEMTILWSCLSVLGIVWGAYQMLNHAWDLPMVLVTVATVLQMHLWKFVNRDLSEMNERFAARIEQVTEIATAAGVSLLVLAGVLGVGISLDGLDWQVKQDTIMWVGPLLAIASVGLAVYGKTFGFFWLAAISQIVLVFSSLEMVRTAWFDQSANHLGLSLICVLGPVTHLMIANLRSSKIDHPLFTPSRQREFLVAQITLLALVASSWVYCHVPASFHVPWLILLAMSLYVACQKIDKGCTQWQAAIAASLAIILYGTQLVQQELSFTSLTALFAVILIQQIARQYPTAIPVPEKFHQALMTTCSVLLFFSVTVPSDQMHLDQYFHSLTIVWTCLGAGFMVLGLTRSERVYRMMGLAVWAFALTSLIPAFLGMSTEMKIASTFVLGSVFILFGYFYTRYKDQIRDLI